MAIEGKVGLVEGNGKGELSNNREEIISEHNRLLIEHNTYTAAMQFGSPLERFSYFIADIFTMRKLDVMSRDRSYSSTFFG